MRILGTVRLSYVDSVNKPNVLKAAAQLKNASRGSWCLVRAYDAVSKKETNDMKKKHKAAMNKLPRAQQVPFKAPSPTVSEKAGFILFMDNKLVIFYTNDLAHTPTEDILNATSESCIAAVRGLVGVRRWIKDVDIFHRSLLQVPVMILIYNIFMSGVDRLDQQRSTNPIRRREKRVSRTVFGLIFDTAMANGYSLMQQSKLDLNEDFTMTLADFKHKVATQLVQPFLMEKAEKSKKRKGVERVVENIYAADV